MRHTWLPVAKLVSIFVQALLYGAYIILFAITCWVLVERRPRGQPSHRAMFAISLVMFVIATIHMGVNFARIIKAFAISRESHGGPHAFFYRLSEPTQIFGSALYIVQTLVGDGVVLLRCYLVWNRQLSVIILPILLLLSNIVTGLGILYTFARIVPEAEIFVVELSRWIIAFFSLTLATNIICTTLVAYRIWSINRKNMSFSDSSLRPIMLLVIESGAIYSATLLTLLILYKAKSWFQYVLLDAVSSIVGLVFSMIIIRIGLGLTSPSGEAEDFGRISKLHFSHGPNNSATSLDTDSRTGGELGPFVAAPSTLDSGSGFTDLSYRDTLSSKVNV